MIFVIVISAFGLSLVLVSPPPSGFVHFGVVCVARSDLRRQWVDGSTVNRFRVDGGDRGSPEGVPPVRGAGFWLLRGALRGAFVEGWMAWQRRVTGW